MQRRVEVAVRVRPAECDKEDCVYIEHDEARVLRVVDHSGLSAAGQTRRFAPDLLFAPDVTNEDIFAQLIEGPLEQATVTHPDTLCFLAYGHTNSGKTHTITGSGHEKGVLTLCVEALLRRDGAVEVAMLEVYMDRVYDLLAEGRLCRVRRRVANARRSTSGAKHGASGQADVEGNSRVHIRREPATVVEGLTTCLVTSDAEWAVVAQFGLHSRRTAPTERNPRSSRSHAIFTVKTHGVRLCFVDLAGSERQTVFSPQLNQESIAINKSLSRLSTVLEALSNIPAATQNKPSPSLSQTSSATPYVNFRDTTLTVLLQRYLCGASRTTFLACVHPATTFYAETISTLRYTQRLRRIKTRRVQPGLNESEMSGLLAQGIVRNRDELQSLVQRSGLVAELLRLQQAMKETCETSRVVQEAQRARISALEAQLKQQQQQQMVSSDPLQAQAIHYHSDISARDRDTTMHQANLLRRVQETRRLMDWLLRRAVAHLPSLHVAFDQYFDDYVSGPFMKRAYNTTTTSNSNAQCVKGVDEEETLQVIGYVSTMTCLPPRSENTNVPNEKDVRLAFLDVGDFALALTMLDGGVPPHVALHIAGRCRDAAHWNSEPLRTLAESITHTTAMMNNEDCEDNNDDGMAWQCNAAAETRSMEQTNATSDEEVRERVYVLAFFAVTPGLTVEPLRPPPPQRDASGVKSDVPAEQITTVDNNNNDARTQKTFVDDDNNAWLPCCDGYRACEPLLPLAVVLAVRSTAASATKECVLQRLLTLHAGQAKACAALCEKCTNGVWSGCATRTNETDFLDCATDTERDAVTPSERRGPSALRCRVAMTSVRQSPDRSDESPTNKEAEEEEDALLPFHYHRPHHSNTSECDRNSKAHEAMPVLSSPPPLPSTPPRRAVACSDSSSSSRSADTEDEAEAVQAKASLVENDAPLLLLSPPPLPPLASALRTVSASSSPSAASPLVVEAESRSGVLVTRSHYLLPASPRPAVKNVSRSASRFTKEDSLDTPGLSRERGGALNTPEDLHGPLSAVHMDAMACPRRVMQDVVDAMRGASVAVMQSPSSMPMSYSAHDGRTSLTPSPLSESSREGEEWVHNAGGMTAAVAVAAVARDKPATRRITRRHAHTERRASPTKTAVTTRLVGTTATPAVERNTALILPAFSAQEERPQRIMKESATEVSGARRRRRWRRGTRSADTTSTNDDRAVKLDACSTCRVA